MDQGRKADEKAAQNVNDSYKAAQQYAGNFDLAGLVRRDVCDRLCS
jgi:hypothetical protein